LNNGSIHGVGYDPSLRNGQIQKDIELLLSNAKHVFRTTSLAYGQALVSSLKLAILDVYGKSATSIECEVYVTQAYLILSSTFRPRFLLHRQPLNADSFCGVNVRYRAASEQRGFMIRNSCPYRSVCLSTLRCLHPSMLISIILSSALTLRQIRLRRAIS
jgi:hypothetical protein